MFQAIRLCSLGRCRTRVSDPKSTNPLCCQASRPPFQTLVGLWWVHDGAAKVRSPSSTPAPIPSPRLRALLDVEMLHPVPLDIPGRRWPPRLVPVRGRTAGLFPPRAGRPVPLPSPIVGAAPRPPACTASSGRTSRATWPKSQRPTPWARVCPPTWRKSSEVTCAAASWRTGSHGPGAPVVVTSSWSRFPAKPEAHVPRAGPAAWPRPPPIWWTMSSPTSRCASSCCRFPNV